MRVKSRRCGKANSLIIKVISFFVQPSVGRTSILKYLIIKVITIYDVSKNING